MNRLVSVPYSSRLWQAHHVRGSAIEPAAGEMTGFKTGQRRPLVQGPQGFLLPLDTTVRLQPTSSTNGVFKKAFQLSTDIENNKQSSTKIQ